MPSKPIYTEVDGQRLKLTNLHKMLYPTKALTKAEVISYALEVAPLILKYIKNRPLTLIRFPDGVDGKRFYTKNKPSWTPDWIPTTYLPWDEENEYIHINHNAHVVWLANLAALEIHTMNSSISQINLPDQFTIDLDPPEDADFSVVKTLSLELKEFLEQHGYQPFAKLSGGKGIHIICPIKIQWDYEVVVKSVKSLMRDFIKTHSYTTLFVHKNKRKDKVLLDIYRNHPGNTTIAPYSLRGKPGAPISMPLPWDAIEKMDSAQAYDLPNVLAYLKNNKDPWDGIFDQATNLHDQETKVAVPESLNEYTEKRDFDKTGEPAGSDIESNPHLVNNKFVIQLHRATNLHYDLRLGVEGVLKSWAIPKGLPISKGVKRLAIQTEDHPAKYIDFEGTIPKEEYGGGEMWIFETGEINWVKKSKGKYKFTLKGKHLNATFSLYKMKNKEWIIERSESVLVDYFKRGIKPMLATSLSELPKEKDNYLYEIKWDGIRALFYKKDKEVKLLSRSGRDIIDHFPEFKNDKHIKVQHAIIDVELVCLDPEGKPMFSDIISRMHRLGKDNIAAASKSKPAYMYAFDCLYLDGKVTHSYPLTKRKAWLKAIMRTGDRIRISHVFENGQHIYDAAKAMGLEGIMAKTKNGHYFPGKRSDTWKKIKFRQTIDCYIIGFTKGKGDRVNLFGSLHLANKEGDQWKYFGKVGTGYDQKKMAEIWEKLNTLERVKKPIKESVDEEKKSEWIIPQFICEVSYASYASTGTLREPVFIKMWKAYGMT